MKGDEQHSFFIEPYFFFHWTNVSFFENERKKKCVSEYYLNELMMRKQNVNDKQMREVHDSKCHMYPHSIVMQSLLFFYFYLSIS